MANKTNIKTSLTIFVFLPVMVVLLAGATSVYGRAPTILLVSDCSAPGTYTGVPPYDVNERDNTLVWFLEGLGCTVDTSGMNKAYQEGQNPFSDPAKLAALDAANLVLVSRHTNSLYYDNDRQNWNKLEKPLLLMSGYLTRGGSDNKWGWTTGGSADATFTETRMFIEPGQETHPFVTGFTSPITAFDWSSAPTPGQAPKSVFLPNSLPVAGAIVIGRFDVKPILMDIPAGTKFDAGNTNGPYGIAGGRRVLLTTWGYDIYLGAPYNWDATFTDFLTKDYLDLFAQTLDELIPGPIPETIYVDADASGAGDGRSWPTAFKYLQDALAIAWTGDEIRVAQGTYKPDANSTEPSGSGDRTETFRLKTGIAIHGGYAGLGEPNSDARDIEAYETILSGDIGTVDVNTDNSYHVVTGSGTDATAILDGFTITGGNANDPEYHNSGGGMYNYSSSPTVANCTFRGNQANSNGGGMCNSSSRPTLTNCTFSNNSATGNGGGMYNYYDGSPTVTMCTFSGNTSGGSGGGIYNNYCSSPTVSNCTFSGNTARGNGGGMSSGEVCSPTVTDCTFSGNTAIDGAGGGIVNAGSSSWVANCIFSDNTAGWHGGGMYNAPHICPTVINCTFSNNTTSQDGGGMYNSSYSRVTVTNCIFNNNYATNDGGGMLNWAESLTMINCTFTGNLAHIGGGMRNNISYPPTVTVANSILWGNTAQTGPQIYGGSPTVTYSNIQDGYAGTGNTNADPCFVNPDANDYHLKPDSPCIDAGDTTAVPDGIFVDADGNPRGLDDPQTLNTGVTVFNVTVDIGAYEFQICRIDGDINCDGVVNFKDLAILCNNWLAGTEP